MYIRRISLSYLLMSLMVLACHNNVIAKNSLSTNIALPVDIDAKEIKKTIKTANRLFKEGKYKAAIRLYLDIDKMYFDEYKLNKDNWINYFEMKLYEYSNKNFKFSFGGGTVSNEETAWFPFKINNGVKNIKTERGIKYNYISSYSLKSIITIAYRF